MQKKNKNEFGLSPDMRKCLYRGNFSIPQAALYLGVRAEKVKQLIDQGVLGTVKVFGHTTIAKVEIDRFLVDNTVYQMNSKIEDIINKLKGVNNGKPIK